MTSKYPSLGSSVSAPSSRLDELIDRVDHLLNTDLVKAESLANDVVVTARLAADTIREARGLHLRGWARFGLGDMAGALQDQLVALEMLTESSDEQTLARALHAAGTVHLTLGDSSVAIEQYEQALEIQTRIGDRWGEARTRNGFAIGMREGGNFQEADAAYREVSRAFADAGDMMWSYLAQVNRCDSQLGQVRSGELSEPARTRLLEATLEECSDIVRTAEGLGPEAAKVELYARHARIGALLELDRAEEALDRISESQPTAEKSGDMSLLVELEMLAARALEAAGKPESVFARLDKAEQLANAAGREGNLAQSFELRAEICEGRGDLADALAAYRRFHELSTKATKHANALRAKVIRSLLDTQRAEHDLALARNRVENLEASTEARKTMVSTIAHELRNPITTVLGLSSEVYRTWADLSGDEGRELIAMIRDEAEDLANIVEDLLAAARIERGGLKVEPEMCDLDPIVETVLARSTPEGKSITSVGAANAFVDPSRFRQILRNLVTNAIRYGGDRITVFVASEGPLATVEVRDSGEGIPFADRNVIFEPFERGDGSDHGTRSIGLGLAVTRDLARLMDGDITYTHDGIESVFRLTLPACG